MVSRTWKKRSSNLWSITSFNPFGRTLRRCIDDLGPVKLLQRSGVARSRKKLQERAMEAWSCRGSWERTSNTSSGMSQNLEYPRISSVCDAFPRNRGRERLPTIWSMNSGQRMERTAATTTATITWTRSFPISMILREDEYRCGKREMVSYPVVVERNWRDGRCINENRQDSARHEAAGTSVH